MAPVSDWSGILPERAAAQEEVGYEYYRQIVTWVFTEEGIQNYIETGLRILDCESDYGEKFGTLHLGPWQFAEGTWAGTPQGRLGLDPEDPVASTEAAAWMIKEGRIGEWDCYRPMSVMGLPGSGEGRDAKVPWDTFGQILAIMVVAVIAIDYLIASWTNRRNG